MTIFKAPPLDSVDHVVLAEIHGMRRALASHLRAPRRWQGSLRRTMLARAIRGSNSIEGYVVDEDDAAAALDDVDPLSADALTFAEIRGYRQALGFVLQMAADPHFDFDTSSLRSMHYMMLSHDLAKSPGQYRTGPIYVRDDKTGQVVYEGPLASQIPALVSELALSLRENSQADAVVRAAMAHLNLVMIHPFRDGNGRMARALQTQVLSRDAIVEPAFSSIEEWLGHNADDYYRVLACTGQGAWHPERDAHHWVAFNLRAHHMQAQTIAGRIKETGAIWEEIDHLVTSHGLPERVSDLLFDAINGYRLRRSTYVKSTGIEERTASRDLGRLVDEGLLRPVGETKGRHYVATHAVLHIRRQVRGRRDELTDPYPHLRAELVQQTS
ncbi:Fic family protein [Fodinicola feengrottensis]|nr:Fic family protein [Fodinicola feengrottensis]